MITPGMPGGIFELASSYSKLIYDDDILRIREICFSTIRHSFSQEFYVVMPEMQCSRSAGRIEKQSK